MHFLEPDVIRAQLVAEIFPREQIPTALARLERVPVFPHTDHERLSPDDGAYGVVEVGLNDRVFAVSARFLKLTRDRIPPARKN